MMAYTESMLLIFYLAGLRPRLSYYQIYLRVVTQLLTSSLSSRNCYRLYQLRNTYLTVFCSCQPMKICYLLIVSITSGLLILLSTSHSIRDRHWLFWKMSRRSCLVLRNASQRVILCCMMSSLGQERRAYRLQMRSSTAEWQVCSCWMVLELMVLESSCSVNSSMKFIVQIIFQQQRWFCNQSNFRQIKSQVDFDCLTQIKRRLRKLPMHLWALTSQTQE